MRGKRQDRPHNGSGRSSLAARAQSEAEPVGGGLRRLPRAKKLRAGGVASPGVGGAPSLFAERWGRVWSTVLAAGEVESVVLDWPDRPHPSHLGCTACPSLETK